MSCYALGGHDARAASTLSFQNVHQFTQPIIYISLVVFPCVHIGVWSLLNEFLDSFEFVFEFPDLIPQIVGDRTVRVDYGFFASRISSSCLCHVSRWVKKRTELKKCDPAGEG